MPRGRYGNLAELGDEDRENKLETKTVEYLVHGLFARSEKEMGENKNGRHGAWWVDLDKILATIAADDLKQKLQAFEEAQKATRDEAIAAAMERKEEAAAADDSCSCHVHVHVMCMYVVHVACMYVCCACTSICREVSTVARHKPPVRIIKSRNGS